MYHRAIGLAVVMAHRSLQYTRVDNYRQRVILQWPPFDK